VAGVGLGRGGRRWAPPKTDIEEERALAVFLRGLVDASGLTMTAVAERMRVGKSTLGGYLSGVRVVDVHVIEALVTATVADSRLHERRCAEAKELRHKALHPGPRRPPGQAVSVVELAEVRAQQVQTYERLTRAMEQREELRETAGNSARLVMVLLSMVDTLQRRIQELDDGTHRRELDRARRQQQQALEELDRAQAKQREAEELAARVQHRLEELTDELDRLRTGTTPDPGDTGQGPHGGGEAVQMPAGRPDPVGDDIEKALAQAAAVNDRDSDTLRRITDELTPTSPPDNTADNPPISTNTPDKPSPHPSATDVNNLHRRFQHAQQLGEAGDVAAAVEEFAALLLDRIRVQGPDHPDTLDAQHNLASWRGKAGDATAAVIALAALLPDRTRVLGANHPHTLATLDALNYWGGQLPLDA
jgi:transcriptional regulator with XRE-family HTH domain